MLSRITRRQTLPILGLAPFYLRRGKAAPTARIEAITTISMRPLYYHGWPTLARRSQGELLAVCSGGREGHVCPFGWVEMMRSRDDGRNWSYPEILMDSAIDDRDAGVCETAKGSILVTTFTSLAYQPLLEKAEALPSGSEKAWPGAQLRRWQAAHRRLDSGPRKALLGTWMLRSADGGETWSAPFRVPVNSPHGPTALSDGRVLYVGKQLWSQERRNGAAESADDGQTWRWLSEIPTRPGDDRANYHELHAVETADRRILAQIRNHNSTNERETIQCESSDGGKTWSVPRPIGVWGLPSHLLKLRDGRLLMTYGHRRKPFGNQARLSEDHGRTWSEPISLSTEGAGGDLGYPSTVELADRTLLTLWYERLAESPRAVLRTARWSL
ncbi:MAG: sialidase family protein [Bryobacteraceae bacterium]